MSQPQRPRFLTVSDWHTFIQPDPTSGQPKQIDLGALRRAVYSEIESLRERPLLVYAAKFPTPPGAGNFANSIDLGDVDGFSDLVATANGADRVDVLLHSPGGAPDATERIVHLLRSKFKEITFLIPHSAYSAATMLALSGNEVILHPTATLGPIDPQLNGTPARSIQRGFLTARETIKTEGPEALPAYIPLLEQYSLHLLELCEDSLELSKTLLRDWLTEYMFENNQSMTDVIREAVEFFSNYELHLTHSRPLTFDRVSSLGLKISQPDTTLEELMREAYILISGFFGVTPFVKLYENNGTLSWGTQQIIQIPSGLRNFSAPSLEQIPFSSSLSS
jgi:Serine dehydrogenase proteinase